MSEIGQSPGAGAAVMGSVAVGLSVAVPGPSVGRRVAGEALRSADRIRDSYGSSFTPGDHGARIRLNDPRAILRAEIRRLESMSPSTKGTLALDHRIERLGAHLATLSRARAVTGSMIGGGALLGVSALATAAAVALTGD